MTQAFDRPPKFEHGFPLRENCDPNNPYEAYLWMLVALPGQNGGQLIMPVEYLQHVSKRLWDLNGPPSADWEPLLKYQRPLNTEAHWMTSPGRWVPPDTPDPDPRSPARRAVDSLVPQQRAELFNELYKDHTPRERYELMQKALEDDGVADDN